MSPYYKIFTAKAPVNIAVIKYWGKADEALKIPINDSISGTLSIDEMCATTSIAISDNFNSDELWLNGSKQSMSNGSNAKLLLEEIRMLSKLDSELLSYKVHIVSYNNFPTAAGLASSAAGYACLAFVLGRAYGISDPTELSKLARRGSGSACRSLFGGFVQWHQGRDHESSKASQVVDDLHWPAMRVIICVINDAQKDVSSSEGMLRSVQTSQLLKYRSSTVVPERISKIKSAILDKDFERFASITMQDSNQFHAICLDTFPPLFYLNDTSRQVVRICSIINAHYGCNKVAYTFDAGPNACIYLLDDFVDQFISLMKSYFLVTDYQGNTQPIPVKGRSYSEIERPELETVHCKLDSEGIEPMRNAINYLIHTTIGGGPKLIDEHIDDRNLTRP